MKDRCNQNEHWTERRYCRETCSKLGLGYEGERCASPFDDPPWRDRRQPYS